MNFKTFLESNDQDEIYDVTITLKPITISEDNPITFNGEEYVSLRALKKAIIEYINYALVNPWELNFELYIDHKQQFANAKNTPIITFSVSGYKAKDKTNRTVLKTKILAMLADKYQSANTGQRKTPKKDYTLNVLKSIKIESESDRFKKTLKPETQKTFGGLIDEL